MVTDSPGLGDSNFPVDLWITGFNALLEKNPNIDMCMIVIEKKERVDTNTVLAF
jgi:hypothetical protein